MISANFDAATNLLTADVTGHVTHDDYDKVLTPAVDQAVRHSGKINLLYRVGPDFEGFGARAMWDDARLGISHWGDFRRIAVVTDIAWLGGAVRAFMAMMPAEVRLFDLAEEAEARAWAGEESLAVPT